MTTKAPFQPAYGTGQTVAPAAASATITLGRGTKQVMLSNLGAAICYVRIGAAATPATVADCPVLAGSQVTITRADDDTQFSHISATGTTLHVICGEGF